MRTRRRIDSRRPSHFAQLVFLPLAIAAGALSAAEHTVGQKDKAFEVDKLLIQVGDTVHFPNRDPFFHNVFSLSQTATFDLGSYPQGESRSVTFELPGLVDVECAIHPDMYMLIEVLAANVEPATEAVTTDVETKAADLP